MKISKEALRKLIREEYERIKIESFEFEEYDDYEKDYQKEIDEYIKISIKNSELKEMFKKTLEMPTVFKDKDGNKYELDTKSNFSYENSNKVSAVYNCSILNKKVKINFDIETNLDKNYSPHFFLKGPNIELI